METKKPAFLEINCTSLVGATTI